MIVEIKSLGPRPMTMNDQLVLDAKFQDAHKNRAPNIDEGEYFEIFAAEQVLKDFELSDDELENGRVGGTDDGGLGGLYFLVNRQLVSDDIEIDAKTVTRADLVLIQATRETSFNETRVDKLLLLTQDLLDLSRAEGQLQGTYNPVLLAAIARFKDKYKAFLHVQHDFTIAYYYVCKGNVGSVNAALEKKRERVKEKVAELFTNAKCIFAFVGAAELLSLVNRSPLKSYPLTLAETPMSPRGQQAFVCLVPILEYYKFVVDEAGELRHQLFESNVRDWQGKVKVNEEIKQSLEDNSAKEDFWWLNNGITILAAGISSHGGQILRIEEPQIVNGLQTSRSIFNYVKTHTSPDEHRNVLVRIIKSEELESQDRIIKATNSQTVIPEYRLHATEKIHRDIETVLRSHGLFYDRRKNFYKNQNKPIAKVVEPLYLAQAVIAVLLQEPNNARARPSTVLKSRYNKVFSPNYPLELYAKCALLMKKVDGFLRSPEFGIERKDRVNLRWYIAAHYSSVLVKAKKAPPRPTDFASLVIPGDNEILSASYEFVNGEYISLGGTDQVAKGNELVSRIKKIDVLKS